MRPTAFHVAFSFVIAALVAAVLATSAIFGLATFIFAYTLEDRLFSNALDGEIVRQQQGWRRDGQLPGSGCITSPTGSEHCA